MGARVTFSSMHRQLYKGLHRSGWHFAMKGLLKYHDDSGRSVLCDTYMDRTFHWTSSVLISEGVIPYRRPWIGILHHTTDTAFSEHNCTEMFESPALLASLPWCTAILTLSRALQGEVRTLLKTHGFGGVPTIALVHPTERVPESSEFTMEKFERNPHRHVVQIGAWLRDPFAIYKLHLREHTEHSIGLMKAVLHGRHMDNCVRPADNLARLSAVSGHLLDADGSMCRDSTGSMCRDPVGSMCRDPGRCAGIRWDRCAGTQWNRCVGLGMDVQGPSAMDVQGFGMDVQGPSGTDVQDRHRIVGSGRRDVSATWAGSCAGAASGTWQGRIGSGGETSMCRRC